MASRPCIGNLRFDNTFPKLGGGCAAQCISKHLKGRSEGACSSIESKKNYDGAKEPVYIAGPEPPFWMFR